jgi:hypothetical protein
MFLALIPDTQSLTKYLTPWCIILHEKLTVGVQVVKKSREFITVFTKSAHDSLLRLVHSCPYSYVLFFHLRLANPSHIFI